MKKLFALSVASFLALAVNASEFPDVSIKDVQTAIESKKVVLIDVNGTESYQKGRIPGAINFEKHGKDLAKVLPKDKDALIVAYCGGPQCSAYKQAATAAKKLGYKNVKHLSAGISGWKEAGLKVDSGS